MTSVYTNRAIAATNDLIAFYKTKIAELEIFREDLVDGKIKAGHTDFSKYSLNERPYDDKRVVYWKNHPDRKFDHSSTLYFSVRGDDRHLSEAIGICDAAILDFADIIEKIGWENSDPDVAYGQSDEEGYLRYKSDLE